MTGICGIKACGKPFYAKGLCRTHYRKAWRDEHLERARAYARARYIANHEIELEIRRIRREINREHIRQYERDRYAANPKPQLEATKAWRTLNAEWVRKYDRAWCAAHPEYRRAKGARRRAQLYDAKGTFTAADWSALVSRSAHCYWCKRPWTKGRRPTHDHIIPLSKDGPNAPENSVCACMDCNNRKCVTRFDPVIKQGILL